MEPIPLVLEEEIALEGLDGITLETLWFRLSERLKYPLPFGESYKKALYSIVVKNDVFEFFEIEKPRLTPTRLDRHQQFCEDIGDDIDKIIAESYLIYSYHPVDDPLIRGSCQEFKTRKKIDYSFIRETPLAEIEKTFGNRMVIVASQALRNKVLIPSNIGRDCDINNHTYCVLERIGRSRYFGEATSGPNSINDFIKDSKLVHYFRNSLLKNNLVMRQQIQSKFRGKTVQIQLFHLPRFFVIVTVSSMLLTEKLFHYLLDKKPMYAALTEDVRNFLGINVKNFRAFIKSKEHIFDHGMLKKNEVFMPKPNEDKKNKDKLVHAVKIKDPNFDVFTLYSDEKKELEEESGFLDQSRQVMNTSLAWQVVEKIEQTGTVGMSQAEIGNYFGLSRLNARAIIRKVTKSYDITSYLKDEGRQRTSRYVHKKFKQDKTKEIVDQVARLVKKAEAITSLPAKPQIPPKSAQLNKPKEESVKVSIPLNLIQPEPDETEVINILQQVPNEEISSNENSANVEFPDEFYRDPFTMEVEEPCVIGNIENVEVSLKFLNQLPNQKPKKGLALAIAKNKVSEKVLNRMNIILDILKDRTMVDCLQLLHLVRQKEEHLREVICRKSMLTLCNQLTADNFLKVIELELKSPSKTVKTLYFGEPHITLDMRCWHSIIEEQKLQHFLRPIEDFKQEHKMEPTISNLSFISKASEGVGEFSAQSIKYHGENFPKFQKYKLFHEFLYYLIYDYPKDHQKIPTIEAVTKWKKEIQNIPDLDEISKCISTVYSSELNWKMFVPPLNPYRDYENGWGLLRDIIHRVPLILYVKFTRYACYVPDLKEYLDHPIKCNYLIHFLPPHVKNALLQGRKHVQVFHDLCKRMVFLGLLQMGPNRSKEIDYAYVYLNRNGSVLDTTTSSGKYAQVDVLEYAHHRYFFNSPQIIDDYWKDMMDICINTPIGKINAPDFEHPGYDRCSVKPTLMPYLKIQTHETAPENDKGEIPGDKRGAAGLDTWLLSHARKNWSKEAIVVKRKRKLPRLPKEKSAKRLRRIKEEKDDNGELVKKVITVRKRIRKKPTVSTKRILTKAETLTGMHRTSITRKVGPVKKVKKRDYDEVDKKALSLVPRGGRCVWSNIEDETLLLIKAAMKFLFRSDSQCSYFCPSVVIRDILHWRTSKGLDKTNDACKRRILYLLKRPECREKMNIYVEELSVTREFKRKFNHFTKILVKNKKSKDIIKIVKIYMVELVHRMHQYFLKKFMSTTAKSERIFELPVGDLNSYSTTIFSSDSLNDYKYKEPTTPKLAEISSLASLIHSGLSTQRDKTSNEYYLYETYRRYSDSNLSEATNLLRRLQVISAKAAPSKSKYTLSNRYALQLSSLHISVELFDEYLEGMRRLSKETPQQMKIVNCGTIFMLAEMLLGDKIELTLEKAEKLIMVDPSLMKKTNFDEISEKYMAALKEDEKKTQEKVKALQFNNDSSNDVKFYHFEDPIEIFFKFDDFYLHIFCILSAIENGESVRADRWTIEEEKCSLKNCIFNSEMDFGDNLMRIATENSRMVEESLNTNNSDENSNLINQKNIVKFFDTKIKEFEEKSIEGYKKDVGKNSTHHSHITTKFLLYKIFQLATENEQEDGAWLTEYKKISTENSDEIFDEDEEVDPIKHSAISHQLKELNVPMRSSDSFVVNLSTIHIDVRGKKCGEIEIDGDLYDKRLVDYTEDMRKTLIEKIKQFHIWMPEEFVKRSLESELSNICEDFSFLKEICEFIIEKGEMGATASELTEKFSDKKKLEKEVKLLVNRKIIVRAGINQIRFVHKSCASKWLLQTLYLTEDTSNTSEETETPAKKAKIDENPEDPQESSSKESENAKKYVKNPYNVLPAPWIRVGPLNRTINQRCLDKWLGTIVNYLSTNPGILLTDLRNKFNVLNPVHLRELCEILEEIGCVKLMTHDQLEVDIFADYCGESEIVPATYFDPFDKTFLEVSADACQRLSVFIGKHYYKAPFI